MHVLSGGDLRHVPLERLRAVRADLQLHADGRLDPVLPHLDDLLGGSGARPYEEPLCGRRRHLADRVPRGEARDARCGASDRARHLCRHLLVRRRLGDALERPHAVDPLDGGALRLPRHSGERLLYGGLRREAVGRDGVGTDRAEDDAGLTR